MIESPRSELDAAIDRVAARMVDVPEHPGLLSRTLARLPEREVTPWFMAFRVQMAAAAAVLFLAFVFARPLREARSVEWPPLAVASPNVVSPAVVAPASAKPEVHEVAFRLPASDSRLPALERPDHERSLAPVEAIDALELVGIAPPAMELDAATALEPLVLPELALDTKGDS